MGDDVVAQRFRCRALGLEEMQHGVSVALALRVGPSEVELYLRSSAVQPLRQLAQVNISRLKAPLTDPLLADFMVALAPVNAVADAATGFVWRLQTEDGDATAIRAFEWDVRGSEGVIVNMSVWTGIPTLMDFVYGDAHRVVLRRRRRWFERVAEATTALWWVPEGHRPTTGEAELRVLHLRERGPTAHAFTVRELYPAPDGTGYVGADDDWQCPV